MRKMSLALALCAVIVGNALAINPDLSAGGGGMNVVNSSGRDVCWSEPANLDGLIVSSEEIGSLGLTSEVANDFYLTGPTNLVVARWWGGYYNGNGCGDVGVATNWNLRIYDSGDPGQEVCAPVTLLCEYPDAFANETYVYCQGGSYPIFQYQVTDLCCQLTRSTIYWFDAQASNHAYPPQVGRVASAGVLLCDSAFKSGYFGYPNWTPAIDVFGVAYDASQEFECGDCGVPAKSTTWGAIKGLYR